jgi:hypothetical protein
MAKIDFDSDSAPFTGAVLPTIEDVALLASDDGKYEIEPHKRSSAEKANKIQAFLLPVVVLSGLLILVFFHTGYIIRDESGRGVIVGFDQIPVDKAGDIRIVQGKPNAETVGFARKLVESGRKVVFFYSKDNDLNDEFRTFGIDFYPVPTDSLEENGVLLDGYKWYRLAP